MAPSSLFLLTLLPFSLAQETILGAYMFHRHGDRTPKSLPPASLTDVGYAEVYQRGQYYRSRYVSSDASAQIQGLNADQVELSQLSVSAPSDSVLQNSAQGFLQGLYPPVGAQAGSQTLRNGSTVQSPLNGYQLIPIGLVSSGSGSEDNTWLQDASGCSNAQTSSNNYFYSTEYQNTLDSTRDFYANLTQYVNGTFNETYMTFKNGYASMSPSVAFHAASY